MTNQVHGQRFTRNQTISRSFIKIQVTAIALTSANKIAVRYHVPEY